MKNIMIVLLLCGLAFLPRLEAKEYDLQTILKLAEENNNEIKLAQAELQTASAEKLSAISRALPSLNVTGGYNRNFKDNVVFFTANGEVISFDTSFKNEFQMNAVLSQTLFSFEVGQAIQAARYLDRLTKDTYDYVTDQVLTNVKKSFYNSLLLQEVLAVAVESEASAKQNYETTKLKFENGVVSEFELLQAEVRWQNSIPETIRARQNADLSLNNLKALTGIPIEEALSLKGNVKSFPELPEAVAFSAVAEDRADYNALIWEKKLREKDVSAQRAGFFPTLDATLRYSFSAFSDEFKIEQDNDNIVLGLSLNIPVFSGGSNMANVRRAKAEVAKVNTRISQADDNIRVELQNLQLLMREARQRIEASSKAALSARRAFEIAETRLANGLATQVELKDSRVALDQSQVNHYSAIFEYLSAYFDWELAIGQVAYVD